MAWVKLIKKEDGTFEAPRITIEEIEAIEGTGCIKSTEGIEDTEGTGDILKLALACSQEQLVTDDELKAILGLDEE